MIKPTEALLRSFGSRCRKTANTNFIAFNNPVCFTDQSYETNNWWWDCLLRKILAKVKEDLLTQETITGEKPSTKSILCPRQEINELHSMMWKHKYPFSRKRMWAAFSAPQLIFPKTCPQLYVGPGLLPSMLVNYAPCWHGAAQHNVKVAHSIFGSKS